MLKKWYVFPALLLGYVLYQKFVLSRTFSVFFKDLNFQNLTLLNPTIDILVQVNNPTPIRAEIQNITGDLFINGNQVGTVLGITPTVLETGSKMLTIPVTINYAGIASLINILRGKFSYKFVGTILIDYIPIPLKFGYPTING